MSRGQSHDAEQARSDQMRQGAESAKARGEEMAQRGAQQADAQRERAASGMGQAADTVRERGQDLPGGEMTSRMSEKAADSMDKASDYLQEHQVSDVLEDLQRFARNHPTESLIAAGVLGLLLGRAMRG